jgi:hypothetical protein
LCVGRRKHYVGFFLYQNKGEMMREVSKSGLSLMSTLLIVFAGFCFLVGIAQASKNVSKVEIEEPQKTLEVLSVDGFVFSGDTLVEYTGTDSVVYIPSCYSLGESTINSGEITFYNTDEAYCFLEENYMSGEDGYYDFYSSIYTQTYPWTYEYSIENLSFIEGTDYIVTKIDSRVFANRTDIEKVVIPNTIESIGLGAFQYCSNLKEIELNEGLLTIGDSAFWGCKIENIVIPNTVKEIYPYAFFGCTKLVKATLSSSLEKVYVGTFNACSNLEEVTILSKNEVVATSTSVYQTFSKCGNLKTIYVYKEMLNYYKTTSPWSEYADKYQIIEEN